MNKGCKILQDHKKCVEYINLYERLIKHKMEKSNAPNQ